VIGRHPAPRDLLARMVNDPHVSTVGAASMEFELPPCPTTGVVCPCSKVTVDDLQMVWDKGFQHLELVKRASLCGTGTCQGSVCLPHLRAFVTAKSGRPAAPFTGRPASRQLTIAEAAADMHLDPFRRTALHDEHIALGARMDRFGGWWRPWNYGNFLDEYWAVREGVSLGDVSTLGKMVVSGPDVVAALERLYPTTIHDIRPGRSRYVLLLNERGHLIDDGMVCREVTADEQPRFVLTFTSGGASFAEAWIRDWIETWALDVHVLDRTLALGAINVTGPLAGELLQRVGVDDPPRFLQHVHAHVAGVPCHVMRLSFTGEASFELHHPRTQSVELWRTLMDAGRDLGVRPHGLQALFALRLEKGHVIVGMDTELDSTPRRLNMEWAVKLDKADFIGRTALIRTSDLDDRRRLFGLTMDGPAPIEGAPIWVDGEIVGHVTSSFDSPGLGRTVMLGWQKHGAFADSVTIDGRRAVVTATPFYDPQGARARA
jgi:sarcosine oxidase subunit alpha